MVKKYSTFMAHYLFCIRERVYMVKTFTPPIILLFTSIIFLFAACKKEEKIEIPEEFPVNLNAERWEVRANTRLFSNNTEIKDQSVVQSFENRHGLTELFEVQFSDSQGVSSIRFDSESRVHFFLPTSTYPISFPFDLQRKGNRFQFYSIQPYLINPLAPPSAESLGYFHSMIKYSDGLGQPNQIGERSTRNVWVGHGNFKVLKLSAFSYVLTTRSGSIPNLSTWQGKGVLINEFDTKSIKHLKMSDTLAVKEYSIIYSLEN